MFYKNVVLLYKGLACIARNSSLCGFPCVNHVCVSMVGRAFRCGSRPCPSDHFASRFMMTVGKIGKLSYTWSPTKFLNELMVCVRQVEAREGVG
jgi:hypothetical protein